MTIRGSIARLATSALIVASVSTARPIAGQSTDPPPVWPDEGPATWAPRPTEPAITPNDLRTHVYQLAADSMRGRAAGEKGDYMATAYVAAVFERLGLEPAGEDGYFQVVPLDSVPREYPARNVIAILPGSDPELKDEYVLVGAHNDHVGMVNGDPFDHDALGRTTR